ETSTTAEISTTTQVSTTAEPTTAAPVSTTAELSEQDQESGQKHSTRDLSQFKGKKLIAITFDDGPAGADSTGKLLDNLDKYNARVTFFVVGNRVANYASTLKREYEMGNQIGSHSYTHANLAKLSEQKIKDEISKTDSAIKKVIGVEPDCMRPPYGSINDTVKKVVGKHIITWSIDTLDWKYKNAETVCNNIVNKAFDGAIVLLHDLYPTSVEGALKAMKILQEKGYAFVTVDELAELRGVKMSNSKVYNNFKPAS
ncbi:MAG: polysaccharide deacetylase family protein, partial [Clostridia bacterium]|nr:polysaccharide deacetylase family protein [Clostridia bacterium]